MYRHHFHSLRPMYVPSELGMAVIPAGDRKYRRVTGSRAYRHTISGHIYSYFGCLRKGTTSRSKPCITSWPQLHIRFFEWISTFPSKSEGMSKHLDAPYILINVAQDQKFLATVTAQPCESTFLTSRYRETMVSRCCLLVSYDISKPP